MDELVAAALRPLMENQELRRLLVSVGAEEKQEWLRGAAELGITLLSGLEESGGTPLNAAEEGKAYSAAATEDGDGEHGREVEE
ncbi:hypothetical protein ACFTAO_14680 [Paenibacillus rhizoplanae]